jgi:hypothetical protein
MNQYLAKRPVEFQPHRGNIFLARLRVKQKLRRSDISKIKMPSKNQKQPKNKSLLDDEVVQKAYHAHFTHKYNEIKHINNL